MATSYKTHASGTSGSQSYKELDVYKLAHELAVQVHSLTLNALPAFETYEEGSQVRRSSKAIAAAIVEGFGRKLYQQEFVRHLTYALASSDETKEHLSILFETGSLKNEELFKDLFKRYEELGRKLYRLREAVKQGIKISA